MRHFAIWSLLCPAGTGLHQEDETRFSAQVTLHKAFNTEFLRNVASLQQLIIGCTIPCGNGQDLSQRAVLGLHNTYMILCSAESDPSASAQAPAEPLCHSNMALHQCRDEAGQTC